MRTTVITAGRLNSQAVGRIARIIPGTEDPAAPGDGGTIVVIDAFAHTADGTVTIDVRSPRANVPCSLTMPPATRIEFFSYKADSDAVSALLDQRRLAGL